MDARPDSVSDLQQLRYRLVVEGRLDDAWAGWFECRAFRSQGDRTELEVEVIDQAQLHSVLRRVHDLRLRLVSVARVGSGEIFQEKGGTP
jgi:hypothetical protein